MATVLAGGGTTMTAQTINPYAYAHSQPTRFTDPSGKWVDEYGKWHPCNLLTETASCIGQLPGWFTSNDIPKFGRYAKGVGKSVIKNLDPLNLGALFTQLQTDPIGTAVAMSHMPTDMAKSMIDALRNCDYEAMGELSADIGLTLYGGAELGVGLVDAVGVKPRGTRYVGSFRGSIEDLLLKRGAKEVSNTPDLRSYPVYQQPTKGSCVGTCLRMVEDGSGGLRGSIDDLILEAGDKGLSSTRTLEVMRKRGWNVSYFEQVTGTKNALQQMNQAFQSGDHVILSLEPHSFVGDSHVMVVRNIHEGSTLKEWGITFNDPMSGKVWSMDGYQFGDLNGSAPSFYILK